MTYETTGRGTRDARDADRPVLLADVPHDQTPASRTDVPHGTRDAQQDAAQDVPSTRAPETTDVPRDATPAARDDDNGTRDDAPQDVPPPRPAAVPHTTPSRTGVLGTFRQWRDDRAMAAERRAAEERDAREALAADARDRQAALTAATAATAPRRNRKAAETSGPTDGDAVAPVPAWMRVAGVWIERAFNEAPLVAPLLVSGAFTGWAFASLPMPVPTAVKVIAAILAAIALEGGLWKSTKTYVATLLNGDSTVGNRIVIGLYLLVIAGVIGGHAYVLAWENNPNGNASDIAGAVQAGGAWAPALVASLMGSLGVLVAAKDARLRYRTQLYQLNLVDARAPKFATLSWVLRFFPTFFDLLHAIRFRIASPIEAIEDRRKWKAYRKPPIWPLPAGWDWDVSSRKLVQIAPVPWDGPSRETLHVPSSTTRDAVPHGTSRTEITAGAGTGRPDHGTPPAGTGPSHGTDGTRDAGRGQRDATDGAADDNGTPDVPQPDDGTRDASGTDTSHDLEKYAADMIAVIDRCPGWQQALPPLRPAKVPTGHSLIEMIREGRGGTFNSVARATEVRRELEACQQDPSLVDLVRAMAEKVN